MQTKPLRSIGLDITSQTLDNLLKTNEAFKNLGISSSKALLQSDKAMLRLIVILQNAQNSFGDMQKTINSLSNQIKVFQGSLENLKLAVGDAFQEPMRQALIYINALIMAITKIIRAFVPMSDEAANAAASMEQYADDTEDATDATENQGKNLDIDEFRALNSSDESQLSITEQITAELERQSALYQQYVDSLTTISNQATEIAEKIKDWFIVTDDQGNFVSWTESARTLFSTLTALIALPITTWFANLITSLVNTTASMTALSTASNILRTSGIFLLVFSITQLITGWDQLNSVMKTLYTLLSVLGVALIVFSNQTLLKTLVNALKNATSATTLLGQSTLLAKTAFIGLGATLGVALGAVLTELPTQIKAVVGVLSLLVGVAFAAAIAVGALQSAWSLGIASAAIIAGVIAITSAINDATKTAESAQSSFSVSGFANGGITNANLIMTHENGTREWVGKQGSSTAVVNDSQMSDVMSRSVRNGVLEALSYNTGSEEFTVIVQANLDGEKVYQTTRKVARRHGEKFIKV